MIASDKIIVLGTGSVIIIFLTGLIFYLVNIISGSFFSAAAAAFGITTINFSLGILFIKLGINKEDKTFIFSILGGMVFRVMLMLGLVFISLVFLELSQNNFIFSILFFYILYLFIEIVYLNLRKKK